MCISSLNPQQYCEVGGGGIIISIVQIRKLRHIKVKELP